MQMISLNDGAQARVITKRGQAVARVECNDTLQAGHITLPNGLGLDYPDEGGTPQTTGVAPNELTSNDLADEFVGTPWHKSVPARIEAIG